MTTKKPRPVALPKITPAMAKNEHPWCRWVFGCSHGSDWDTAAHYGFAPLVGLHVRLTTADGRSRPVRIVSAQYIGPVTDGLTREAGIEFRELDTEHYEPKYPDAPPERVRYEDVREVCVF